MRAAKRAAASTRFRSWLRVSLATTTTHPSASNRLASAELRIARSLSVTTADAARFHRSSTLELVLLTCWPPGPDDRDVRTLSSRLGMTRPSASVMLDDFGAAAVAIAGIARKIRGLNPV